MRALWVTRGSLVSPATVGDMVRSAAASGFNTLPVQVRGRGDAYFASRVEPRAAALSTQPPSFDSLAATLALARAEGLRTVRQFASGRPVWAGTGAHRLSSSRTIENILTARRLGADGVVLFSYDSVVRAPNGTDYLSSVGRAAFAP